MNIYDPIHRKLPDCSLPLIVGTGIAEAPYGMAGTGFFARHKSRALFITAAHCLGSTNETKSKSVENLHIPISTSSRDVFRLISWGEARCPDDEALDSLIDGSFDIAVIELDVSERTANEVFSKRCINLPPSGDWFARTKELGLVPTETGDLLLEVRGYPTSGTESGIDFDTQTMVTQGVVVRGHAKWHEEYPHTCRIDFNRNDCPISDFNGLSGSPVLVPLKNEGGFSYSLAGMLINAAQYVGHFVTVPWLVKAANAAYGQSDV